jgi:hypothetical protein
VGQKGKSSEIRTDINMEGELQTKKKSKDGVYRRSQSMEDFPFGPFSARRRTTCWC